MKKTQVDFLLIVSQLFQKLEKKWFKPSMKMASHIY